MLAVLLLAGCIVFDGALSFEYEDFDDESYSFDDEESESMYPVTDLARVRRYDQETVRTLNPDEVKGAIDQIMFGRDFDFISDSTYSTNTESEFSVDFNRFTAMTKFGHDNLTRTIRNEYDNLTPKFRNENLTPKFRNEYYDSTKSRNEYDNWTPKSRSGYDNLTPKSSNEYDNLNPKSSNEYDNLTLKSRNEYGNLTPKSRNEYDNLTPKSRNEYDNLTPKSSNEYDNSTPKSKNEYDNLTPEFEIEYENSTTSTQGEYDTSTKTNRQYDNMLTKTINEYDNLAPMSLKPSLRIQSHTKSQVKQMSISKMADASFHKATKFDRLMKIEPEKSISVLRQGRYDYDPPDDPSDDPPKSAPRPVLDSYEPTRKTTTKSTVSTTTTKSTVSTATTRKKKRRKKTNTTTTTIQTTTKRTKRTTFQFDVEKFLEIVANLTYDYYTNLTREVNETLKKLSVPTCGTPTTTPEPTTTPPTGPPDYAGMGHLLIGKCFVCGLDDEGIPYNANCADAFAGDFIPLVPQDPRAKGQIARFRKYCRYEDVNNFMYNYTMPRSIFGRWTGGCAVRWTDLSGVYTQRTCRNRLHATTGRHFASKRMAKLEMALNGIENGCIISPVATLLPLSRGISLFARFHACVCTGNWCNISPRLDTDVWMTSVIALTAVIAP